MRKKNNFRGYQYKIMAVDDEMGIIDSLAIILTKYGYSFEGYNDPLEAIEKIKSNHYDLLILDFLMEPMRGDKVIERIREFDKELHILLLTGHKDLAPPLETLKFLDIQGYCEKGDKFDQLILLVESAVKSSLQVKQIKKFEEGLQKILKSVPKIYQLQPISNILENILCELKVLTQSNNAFILYDDASLSEDRTIFKGIGEYDTQVEDFMDMLSLRLIEDIGFARTTRQTVNQDKGIILPLINEHGQTIGVIYIEDCNMEDEIEILRIFASQAAASLNNAFLHSLMHIKNEELNRTYDELKATYMDTIEALRLAVDAKDVYTRGHSDRVAYYATKIGREFNLSEKELEMLRIGGVFHDVGKIGTADDILLKTTHLTEEEYEEVKRHTVKGANILSAISMFRDIVPIIKYHHERIDGTGYPEGLKGDEIPFLSRIISVADAFDAMTSDRHYRLKLKLDDAVKQLQDGSGKQFDADVVEVFIKLLDSFKDMRNEIEYTYESAS